MINGKSIYKLDHVEDLYNQETQLNE